MIILVLAIAALATAAPPMGSCETTIKGVVAKKAYDFEEAFNRLRNEVSQGRRANHKGQIEYAANMHIVSWSNGLAKGA